jgi:hypothetical protein
LGEIGADISYIGKAVDVNNNIQPTHLPRGYGGRYYGKSKIIT